jgi:hypothetical protein
MSANLTSPNTYYNTYCNQNFEKQTALAVFSTGTNNQQVVPGSNQLVEFSSPSSSKLDGITLNPASNVLTLSARGVYLVDFNISVDLPQVEGGQATVAVLINGVSKSFDVGYCNNTAPFPSIKLTLKEPITQNSDTPTTISFSLSTLVATIQYRYSQLSIIKIGSV